MQSDIEFRAWNDNLGVDSLEEIESGFELPTVAFGEPASDEFWLWLWRLRRAFWFELIETQMLEVRFEHHAESGYGTGPILRFKLKSGAWSDTRLVATDFIESDTMHGKYDDAPGVFGWSELKLANLRLEEFDDEFFEHSFSSEDALVVVEGAQICGTKWSQLSQSEQQTIVDVLKAESDWQLQEFNELVMDVIDLLCAVAVHPATAARVAEAARAIDSRCAAVLG